MRRAILGLMAGLAAGAPAAIAVAQAASTPAQPALSWSVDANGPGRFVSAHGQGGAIMGYPSTGLEVWSWPLQLVSGYKVRFREPGRIEPLDGAAYLSRIEWTPSETVRVYIGPDFVVREHLFVPSDPSLIPARISYEVEGRPDVQVEVRFQPSLNLQWPGGLGGQEALWDDGYHGYLLREPVHHFGALVRSEEVIAHDDTVNTATNRPDGLGLLLQPKPGADGARRATVTFHLQDGAGAEGLGRMASASYIAELPQKAADHYASVLAEATEITTPDPDLNRALAAATVAVEQAWTCAPQIGCGIVGGYGPSRPGRRPQYAWFFAGDGLIAVEGLLAAGRFERARDELAFIAKYQNKTNGMIWHEMSTSAPLIDWEKRYPYMFVHVDITLQYLSTLADYVETTGDAAFLKAQWPGVLAAWRYARGLVDAKTGLPTIPAGKQGQNEQAVLRDDMRLSAAWVDAADGMARLAKAQGDARLFKDAGAAAALARASIREDGWDAAQNFPLAGHTADGAPVHEERPDAAGILLGGAFTEAQANAALDRISTPDFQTDWGIRSLAASNPNYDPNPYSDGAVWALGTSGVSAVLWKAHRPWTAWSAFHGLVPWASLDSPGHMHEVAAGDLFHPELESVPEQTWSSAGFTSAAVDGLLGLKVHAAERRLEFAPHLPAGWPGVTVRRLRVGASRLDLKVAQTPTGVELEIDNGGPPVAIDFDPQIALGARLLGAEVNGAPATATLEQHGGDAHARLRVEAASGHTRAVIRSAGGVRLAPVETPPRPGDRSRNPKIASVSVEGNVLTLKAYVKDREHAAIDLFTTQQMTALEGGALQRLDAGRTRLVLSPAPASRPGPDGYTLTQAVLRLD